MKENSRKFFESRFSKIARDKESDRKREDAIHALLDTVEYLGKSLPVTVVTMYRMRENSSGRSSHMPFLAQEVAYMLGGIDGTPHYAYNRKFYIPESRQNVVIPLLKEVSMRDVSESMIHRFLENIEMAVGSEKAQQVHASGFFIFRYFLPIGYDKKDQVLMHVPIQEGSIESAITAFQNRDLINSDLHRALDIEVYYRGQWVRVEKVPPLGDAVSRHTIGHPTMALAMQE